MSQPENSGESEEKRLTCIQGAYTLASTQNCGGVEELMVRQFIETLAEVALAVASRKISVTPDEEIVR
jgi:hypothetical protein